MGRAPGLPAPAAHWRAGCTLRLLPLKPQHRIRVTCTVRSHCLRSNWRGSGLGAMERWGRGTGCRPLVSCSLRTLRKGKATSTEQTAGRMLPREAERGFGQRRASQRRVLMSGKARPRLGHCHQWAACKAGGQLSQTPSPVLSVPRQPVRWTNDP